MNSGKDQTVRARLKIAHNPRSSLGIARDVMHYGAEGYVLPIQPTALPLLVSKMVPSFQLSQNVCIVLIVIVGPGTCFMT